MDLFDHAHQKRMAKEAPLAARMRPRTLEEFIGQEDIVGEGRLLRRAIESDRLFSSIILWGPPGTGKTSLAMIIANTTESHFETISAVLVGKPELRRVIKEAEERRKLYKKRTILFVDEVHRWNKAQQDALLPHVENGTITLIGATTENPYFEVISALVSRSRIFQLRPLEDRDVERVIENAIQEKERGFGKRSIITDDDALAHIVRIAGGDARNALNALELAVESTPPDSQGAVHISLEVAQESIQRRAVLYDKDGDAQGDGQIYADGHRHYGYLGHVQFLQDEEQQRKADADPQHQPGDVQGHHALHDPRHHVGLGRGQCPGIANGVYLVEEKKDERYEHRGYEHAAELRYLQSPGGGSQKVSHLHVLHAVPGYGRGAADDGRDHYCGRHTHICGKPTVSGSL